MFAYDFDGDGDNDVLTAEKPTPTDFPGSRTCKDGDEIKFIEHKIHGRKPEEQRLRRRVLAARMRSTWSTWTATACSTSSPASGGGPTPSTIPARSEPAVLYWFQTVRDNGTARFVPHHDRQQLRRRHAGGRTRLQRRQAARRRRRQQEGTFVFTHKAGRR